MSVSFRERIAALHIKNCALLALSISLLAGCNGNGGTGFSSGNVGLPIVASPNSTNGSTSSSGNAAPGSSASPSLQPSAQPTSTALSSASPLPLTTQRPGAATGSPTAAPFVVPTNPVSSPAITPRLGPTASPTSVAVNALPTPSPSSALANALPTASPSGAPANTLPTASPSSAPANARPTSLPSNQPIIAPTTAPTVAPTLTPRPTPTAIQNVPSQTPDTGISTGLASGSITSACTQSVALGTTNTALSSTGNITNASYTAGPGATWEQITYVSAGSTPSPQPLASSTPLVVPTPSSYLLENIYSGTYSIPNAPTACFILIGAADGSSIVQIDPSSRYNAVGIGFALPPSGSSVVRGAAGQITALQISKLSQGSGSGTFRLDNGQTGTITITNFATFESPQYSALSPSSELQRIKARFGSF